MHGVYRGHWWELGQSWGVRQREEDGSQEVCHGYGAGNTGIEGLGRSEGTLREVRTGVECWAPQGHFLLECSGLGSY